MTAPRLPRHARYNPGQHVVDLIIQAERDRQAHDPGPMLTALAVDEMTGLPDPKWFDLARELGRLLPGEDEKEFWVREVQACHDRYGPEGGR